jgi:hypothetical protein
MELMRQKHGKPGADANAAPAAPAAPAVGGAEAKPDNNAKRE